MLSSVSLYDSYRIIEDLIENVIECAAARSKE